MTDEQTMFEDDAAYLLGEKVIEMAERVETMHSVVPGSVASYGFEMDGKRYKLTLVLE